MTLDELLATIPPTYRVDAGMAGFCLRFSVRNMCWIASHGMGQGLNKKFMGSGATPKEAVEDFIRIATKRYV